MARAAGAKTEVIEALNPQLAARAARRPIAGRRACACRRERRRVYAANIEKARAAPDKVETVLLRFGETLDDVARARGIAVRELRRLNGVKDSAELRAGTAIVVPKRAAAAAATGRQGR